MGCIFVVPKPSTSTSTSTTNTNIDTNDNNNSILNKGTIITRGRNRTNQDYNATRHAELVAIDDYITIIQQQQTQSNTASVSSSNDYLSILQNTILYVTIEPCIMCAAALYDIGIKYVIYGADNTKFGGCGSVLSIHNGSHINNKESSNNNNNNNTSLSSLGFTCITGICSNEAIDLLKQFYSRANTRGTYFILLLIILIIIYVLVR